MVAFCLHSSWPKTVVDYRTVLKLALGKVVGKI